VARSGGGREVNKVHITDALSRCIFLFLCHINDLPDRVKSQVRLFADDCQIYREIKSNHDHLILQQDLCSLESWGK